MPSWPSARGPTSCRPTSSPPQVRVLRLSIAELERRRDQARSELGDLEESWESARKALEEARQRFAEVERRMLGLRSVAYDATSDLQERQRRLALLLAGRN
jgi:predicted  nucleic acid-binding Zn-ribbon protein